MRKWSFLRWRNAWALPWETMKGGAYRQGEEGQDFQEVGTARGKAQRHKIACMCRVLPVLWWGQGGNDESCVVEVDRELCIPLEQTYIYFIPSLLTDTYAFTFNIPEIRMHVSCDGIWQSLSFGILLLPAYVHTRSYLLQASVMCNVFG